MGCKIVIIMIMVVLCVNNGHGQGLLGNSDLPKELLFGNKDLPNGLVGNKELPEESVKDVQKEIDIPDGIDMEVVRNKTARYLFIKDLCMQKIGNYIMRDGLNCVLSIDSSGHSGNQYCNVANKVFKITSDDVKKVFPATSEDADRFLNAPSQDTVDALSKINTVTGMLSQPVVYNAFLKQLSVVLDSEPKELCGHF